MNQNTFQENLEQNVYFKGLPPFVQESIRQSGISLSSEEELRQLARSLMRTSGRPVPREGAVRPVSFLPGRKNGKTLKASVSD